MTDAEVIAMFMCVDCTVNTHVIDEYYMVHDHIWVDQAKMHKEGGMLCVGCLEKRIGRELTVMDFTHAPINMLGFFSMSPRLESRHLFQVEENAA